MSNSALSKRYAKAIFELALESKSVDKVSKDFVALHELLEESKNLREAVQNPVVSRAEQRSAMEFILKKVKVTELMERFVGVLINNGRLSILGDSASAYFEMVKEYNGEVTAHVISALPLTAKKIKEIETSLGKSLGKTVNVESEVDASILGGVIVKIGSKMIDASISGGLEKLKIITKEAIAA